MLSFVGIPEIMTNWKRCFVFGVLAIVYSSISSASTQSHKLSWKTEGFFDRYDAGKAVVVDSAGDIYVGGISESLPNIQDNLREGALVAKYSPSGEKEWLTFGYFGPGLDHVAGMAIDDSNNVIIAGETYRYATGAEAYILKFAPGGSLLWSGHFGSPSNEFGHDVVVDSLGNAYVGGSTTGDLGVGTKGSGYDGFVVKYSPLGVKLWSLQQPDHIGNDVETISIDFEQNFFAIGDRGSQEYIAKFDSNRNLLWNIAPYYPSLPGRRTQITESTTDLHGNLYVAGITNIFNDKLLGYTTYDGFVAKHDRDGNLLWQYQLQGESFTSVSSVHVDAEGEVYIAGDFALDRASWLSLDIDSYWAKLDDVGNLQWMNKSGTTETDHAYGIAVDENGVVYTAGYSSRVVNNYFDLDMFLARYDQVPEPASFVYVTVFLSACYCSRTKKM